MQGVYLLVSAFLRGGWVVARLVSIGKWAVVLSITVGGQSVVAVLSRVASIGTILGSLAGWLSHGKLGVEIRFGLDLGLRNTWQSCPTGLLGGSDSPVTKKGANKLELDSRVGERPCVVS